MAIIKVANRAIDLDAAEIPNLDASKITTGNFDASRIGSGTFADARISSSSVSQHAQSFDDNKIVNDISTLAIRQASNENKVAYNTQSMFVDVFQDASGIASNTNAPHNSGEFVSSVSENPDVKFINDGGDHGGSAVNSVNLIDNSTAADNNASNGTGEHAKFGTYSHYYSNSSGVNQYHRHVGSADFSWGSGDFSVDLWFKQTSSSAEHTIMGLSNNYAQNLGGNWFMRANEWNSRRIAVNVAGTASTVVGFYTTDTNRYNYGQWHHLCLARKSGVYKIFIDGVSQGLTFGTGGQNQSHQWGNSNESLYIGRGSNAPVGFYGNIDSIRIQKGSCAFFDANFTPPTAQATNGISNATGNFISNTITAPSSVSSMGAIITYQDNVGTNTLNTDIVLQLSADGGSNYSTATLTAMPDFASGIKMAKVNDLSVTAGTSLKYKISFANQASGSKEARIRGVSLQY